MRFVPAAVLGLVALAVGLAAGFTLGRGGSREEAVPAGPELRRTAELEAENADLRVALAREREARTAAKEAAAAQGAGATVAGAPEAGGGPDGAPAAAAPVALRFFADLYDGALAKIDWGVIGRNMSEMSPLVVTIAKAIRERSPAPPGTVGRIQELNGPILEAALSLRDPVPGTGVNGRFSDPGFMLNALAACLAAASLPLSADQEAALEDLGRRTMAADARRREGYDDRTLALAKVADEAELKDAFFREAFALLTPEQRAVVDPPETRDRLRLCLFSSAVLWAPLTEPCFFEEVADLKKQFLLRSIQILDLSEAERDRAKPIVESWVDSVPDDLVLMETDDYDRRVMVKSSRVTAWARHTVRLIGSLLDTLALDEPRAARGRSAPGVLLPLKVDELPG